MKEPEKRPGSTYDSRYRHKLNMPEPGTVMLKWTGLLGAIGLALRLPRVKAAAYIAFGLAGALLVILFAWTYRPTTGAFHAVRFSASRLIHLTRLQEKEMQTTIIVAVTCVVAMNILSFVLMGCDKRRAREGKWRVSEKTLFLVTACFGGLGGALGMKVFHHKTQHWYFRVFFPLLLAVQIVALATGAFLLMR